MLAIIEDSKPKQKAKGFSCYCHISITTKCVICVDRVECDTPSIVLSSRRPIDCTNKEVCNTCVWLPFQCYRFGDQDSKSIFIFTLHIPVSMETTGAIFGHTEIAQRIVTRSSNT